MTGSTFPGGTSISFLDIYADEAPDGLRGGSPHAHLVSTEAYIVVGGSGALQTIDGAGFRETPLEPGRIVWFTPGTIHRAVSHGDLRVAVLMSNAGLPEAGDAVLTFPTDVLADPAAYARAADLGAGDERAGRARARRDLAVEGFLAIRRSVEEGGDGLARFHRAATELVRGRAGSWEALIQAGPAARVEQSLRDVAAVLAGDPSHLAAARATEAAPSPEPGYGMCGRLTAYDVRGV